MAELRSSVWVGGEESGTVDPPVPQQPAGPPPLSSPSTQFNNITETSPIPSTSSTPGGPLEGSPDQTAETEDGTPDSNSVQLLSAIVDQFVQQGELDDGGLETDVPTTPAHELASNPPVSLRDLFDFTQDYWVEYHQRTSHRSLNEEMEIYSLLDTDLPGDEGTEVAIDDTTGEVLTLNA